ncbi:MAG: electron transfer flavoprotein subunit alpha/FixB family protein, partial [Armatimonadetes bacterium]
MSRVLAIALNPGDAEALAAFCQAIEADFTLVDAAGDAATDLGASRILRLEGEIPPADALAPFVAELGREAEIIVGVAHMAGKDLLPRVAGLLDRPMVGDIVEVLDKDQHKFLRPIV